MRAAWLAGAAGGVVWFVGLLWNLRFRPEIYEPYQRYGGTFGRIGGVQPQNASY